MAAIDIQQATKIYSLGQTEIRALDDVTMTIDDGEFAVLVGPSGSGKTTLLQMMGCLDRPDRGTVKIGGVDITRLGGNARAD